MSSSTKTPLLHQLILEVSGKTTSKLFLLLTGSYTQDEALNVFSQHLINNKSLDKQPLTAPLKYTIQSMSAALATNKVFSASDNLRDIYPKYLFHAKSCSTKIQDFLPKNKDKQEEDHKKDKKH